MLSMQPCIVYAAICCLCNHICVLGSLHFSVSVNDLEVGMSELAKEVFCMFFNPNSHNFETSGVALDFGDAF